MYELLFLHYFPGLRPEDFTEGSGFPADWWEMGKQLIDFWRERGK